MLIISIAHTLFNVTKRIHLRQVLIAKSVAITIRWNTPDLRAAFLIVNFIVQECCLLFAYSLVFYYFFITLLNFFSGWFEWCIARTASWGRIRNLNWTESLLYKIELFILSVHKYDLVFGKHEIKSTLVSLQPEHKSYMIVKFLHC